MVEAITSSQGRPRISKPGEDIGTAAGSVAAKPQGPAGIQLGAGDVVSLSRSAQTLPAELKEAGPPMDLQSVKRIKEAIAEGKYPIDLDAITESLFQDYLDLRG